MGNTKKKVIKTPAVNNEINEKKNITIVDALDTILNAACHSGMEESKLEDVSEEFDYLTSRLSVTRIQALIISMLIDYDNSMYTKNMAGFLGISNIKFLRHINELEELVERNIVRKTKERGQTSPVYEIRLEAQQKYMSNEVYEKPKHEKLSTQEFLEYINDMLNKCSDETISRQDLQKEIKDSTMSNNHLDICKSVEKLHVFQQIFFYFCAVKYVYECDLSISPMEISEFTNPLFSRKLASLLGDGKDDLITNKLVQNSGRNGFTDKDCYTISDNIQIIFKNELGLEPMKKNDDGSRGLKRHDKIVAKPLFYNSAEELSIKDLTNILSVDKFDSIQQRLERHGMRKGFACLFYGSPGTGKTESVMQIARTTGRDIMEVNVTEIKSKWVGDSEKNIRQIFDRYRRYCSECEVMPILLFNEADAIISRRSPNVERSVDKMENAIQNIILEEMEKLDGILIATTNLTSNMDPAFERRFLYKIEFNKPTLDIKVKIWQSMLNELSFDDAHDLAYEYDFSGGQIENIARKDIINNILYDKHTSVEQLRRYCDDEIIKSDNRRTRKHIGFC